MFKWKKKNQVVSYFTKYNRITLLKDRLSDWISKQSLGYILGPRNIPEII